MKKLSSKYDAKIADLQLSEIDWLHDKETLFSWNVLHAPKIGKVRNFTFVQKSGISSLVERIKEVAPKWAYIKHDKDITEDGIHYHFYVEFPNPRSWVAVANDLEIPVTSLQKVLNKRGILEYLTHKNNPEKHHYNDDEIVTNMNILTEISTPEVDVIQEFEDYLAYKQGRITYRDFLTKYNIHCATLGFGQRMRMYNSMIEGSDSYLRLLHGGTCPPCRVPSSNSPP